LGGARDLFKTQQGTVRQIGVIAVENFFGHAVTASEIAAVGDADAQVFQGPLQTIPQV